MLGLRKEPLCSLTLGCQWFINTSSLGIYAGKYTIIGVVIDGMDVLDKMEKIKVGECMWVLSRR